MRRASVQLPAPPEGIRLPYSLGLRATACAPRKVPFALQMAKPHALAADARMDSVQTTLQPVPVQSGAQSGGCCVGMETAGSQLTFVQWFHLSLTFHHLSPEFHVTHLGRFSVVLDNAKTRPVHAVMRR